jgi:hypothetical protein
MDFHVPLWSFEWTNLRIPGSAYPRMKPVTHVFLLMQRVQAARPFAPASGF